MPKTSGLPRVKICGLTNLADTQAAVSAGADYLGFVFVDRSSRHVTAAELTSWWGELPSHIERVALFQNPTSLAVETVLNQLEIDLLQFHGSESPEFCAQFGVPFWKSVALATRGSAVGESFTKVLRNYQNAEALLVDSAIVEGNGQKRSGGTGKQFDWALWPYWCDAKLVLSGGLDAGCVGAAVKALCPAVVDVSTGVESSPGKKDAGKLIEFCRAAKAI